MDPVAITKPIDSSAVLQGSPQGNDSRFWDWALDTTAERAEKEGWTKEDRLAAFVQGSLLSFSSCHCDGTDMSRPNIDFPVTPSAFKYNSPWNSWTPPSQSLRRLKEAQANKKPERVEQRVRVRVCASANDVGLKNSVVAFASIELDGGKRCLQMQRGSTTLASMTLASLHFDCISERMISVAPRPHTKLTGHPVVFLSFEDEARITKFCELLVKK